MKRVLALQIVMSSIVAMEQPKIGRLDISWQEIVEIGKQLYQEHGENLDIHELILMDLYRPVSPSREKLISLGNQETTPRLARRNTSEKISSGLKSACNTLLGIRKISSSP